MPVSRRAKKTRCAHTMDTTQPRKNERPPLAATWAPLEITTLGE